MSRRERTEEQLRQARGVLAKLPASDPRATLLGLAVQRRDLVLIEAVLAQLGEQKPATPIPGGPRRDDE
jgi:hypothetical protein